MNTFQCCHEYIYESINALSWITPAAQIISAIAAILAFIIACRNLGGVKNAQSLQAQMNLISLENEVRKNHVLFKNAIQKYVDESNKSNMSDLPALDLEKRNAFELYISTADKLAALINSDFLTGQFKKRDWKSEYADFFKSVQKQFISDDIIMPGKNQMISNIEKLLQKWN